MAAMAKYLSVLTVEQLKADRTVKRTAKTKLITKINGQDWNSLDGIADSIFSLETALSELAQLDELIVGKMVDEETPDLTAIQNEAKTADGIQQEVNKLLFFLKRKESIMREQMMCKPTASQQDQASGGVGVKNGSQSEYEDVGSFKLQKMVVPKFSGEIMKFDEWWGIFNVAVHSNKSIPTIRKFYELSRCLEGGEAYEGIMKGVRICDDQQKYQEVVDELHLNYGDSSRLISLFSASIWSCPKASYSFESLRKLINTFDSSLRELRHSFTRMCEDEKKELCQICKECPSCKNLPTENAELVLNLFLSPLLLSKMPDQLVTIWKRSCSKVKEIFNFTLLLAFLRKEQRNLPVSSNPTTKPSSNPEPNSSPTKPTFREKTPGFSPKKPQSSTTPTMTLNASSKQIINCHFCKSTYHKVGRCAKFLAMSPKQRLDYVNQEKLLCSNCLNDHRDSSCTSKYTCQECKEKHHTLLHHDSKPLPKEKKTVSTEVVALSCAPSLDTTLSAKSSSRIYLQTAIVKLVNPDDPEKSKLVKALIDSASSRSYIRKSVADELSLETVGQKTFCNQIFGEGTTEPMSLSLVEVRAQNRLTEEGMLLKLWSCEKLASPIPTRRGGLQQIKNVPLADDGSIQISEIDVLIGSDQYWNVVLPEAPIVGKPMLVPSIFGYLLHGPGNGFDDGQKETCFFAQDVDGLQQLWNLETLGISPSNDKESLSTVTYSHSKQRYVAKLPWKGDIRPTPNLKQALRRSEYSESRLPKSKKIEYRNYVQELLSTGIIERTPDPSKAFYLHHFGIWKDGKRLRVVFDGSQVINGLLEVGPNLLQELLCVLLQSRLFRCLVQGDVKGAFLQILVEGTDKQFLNFIFEGTSYRFNRIVFGLCCSPEILHETFHDLFKNFEAVQFETVDKLRRGTYVDDVISGGNAPIEATEFIQESTKIMAHGGFDLCKWKSFPPDICPESADDLQGGLLGLQWDRSNDLLSINVSSSFIADEISTKRQLVSSLGKIFDPLGIVSPWMLFGRTLLQQAWTAGGGWDDPMPNDICQQWKKWISEVHELKSVSFPRYVPTDQGTQIHVFSDASLAGYASCVYIQNQLFYAKARVAPIKSAKMTIPRLELLGCLLSTIIVKKLTSLSHLKNAPVHFWTDSQICLQWMKNPPPKDIFVRNRIQSINSVPGVWHHCPGLQNPADVASRGTVSLKSLLSHPLWWNGPSFLPNPDDWPNAFDVNDQEIDEPGDVLVNADPEVEHIPLIFSIEDVSSYKSIITRTAYVKRFVHNFRVLVQFRGANWRVGLNDEDLPLSCPNLKSGPLDGTEKDSAFKYWLWQSQQTHFNSLITDLKAGKTPSRRSNYRFLRPFLKDDIVYAQPRNGEPPLPLLPPEGTLTNHVYLHHHKLVFHAGVSATLSSVRQLFHVLRGRQTAKRLLKQCRTCRRYRTQRSGATEGALPQDRITPARPFQIIGCDFFGPLYISSGEDTAKRWVFLMSCAVTRAVHMELVLTQSIEETSLAFRRFIAIRGKCTHVYSDNSKTLKLLSTLLASENFNWTFIPEFSPHYGGFYERMNRIIKEALRISLHLRRLNDSELRTVLYEISSAVNSRPLTYVGSSDDPYPLTPAHFLYGCHPPENIDPHVQVNGEMLGRQWNARLAASEAVWKRFKHEYLATLRQWATRGQASFPPVHPGDVVLVEVTGKIPTPRSKWPLARVESLVVGRDTPHSANIILNGKRTRRHLENIFPLECPVDHDTLPLLPVPDRDIPQPLVDDSIDNSTEQDVDPVQVDDLAPTRTGRVRQIPANLRDYIRY